MKQQRREAVLIETYWNVNQDREYLRALCAFVLIETYWNVNDRNPEGNDQKSAS